MRKILLLMSIVLLAAFGGYSQAPGIFNYQGVARNSVGNVLINKTITLRLTVHDGSAAGPTVYQESRTVVTNPFGLFNAQVGSAGATNVSGTIPAVPWGVGNKYLQVEIDPNGGTTFINIGTAQIAAVPYALFTNSAADLVLPFNKTQADAGTLFKITNSGTASGSTALEGLTNSIAGNLSAVTGTVTSGVPGAFSAGIRGINNGTGGNGIGVYGSQNGGGYGVYGTAPSGWAVRGESTSGVGSFGSSSSGTGVFGTSSTGNAGLFSNTNAANNQPTVTISTNSTNATALSVSGPGIWGSAIGITNTTSGMEWRTSVNGTTYTVTKVPGSTFSPLQLFSTGGLDFSNSTSTSIMRLLDNGDVGIGTTTPFSRLTVVQNNSGVNLGGGAATGSEIKFLNAGTAHMSIYNKGNNALTFAQTSALSQTNVLGTELMTLTSGGNLGIGINAPTRRLHVVGGVNITDGTQGLNKILTSDAVGNATWQNPALVLGGLFWSTTGNAATVDGTNFIGTTDNIPFNVRVNNQSSGRIDPALINTSWGYQSLVSGPTGTFNTGIGHQNLSNNTTGAGNTALGAVNLSFTTTGIQNTGVGVNSLFTNTTGNNNTAVGWLTNRNNTTGSNNTSIGVQSLFFNTTGNSNTAVSFQALPNNTTGIQNTAIGSQSLFNSTTGVNNTAVGTLALTNNTTGSNNTALGAGANVASVALINATAIGFNAQVSASNSLVLGSNANVGIGVSNPATKLHVVANAAGTQVELLRNLDVTGYSGTWYQSSGGGLMGHVGYGNPSASLWNNQMFAGSVAAIPLVLTTSDNERMRITPTGEVGIGTTTPFVKFHVNSGNSFNTSMLEAQDAFNAGPHQYFYSGGEFGIVDYIRTDYTGGLSTQRLGALEIRGVNRLNLSPTNAVDMLGGMTIISNGNVGIGQPTPVAKLDVLKTGIGVGTIKAYQPNEINVPTIKSFGGGVIVNDVSIIGSTAFRNSAVYAQSGNFAVGSLNKVNFNPDAIYATGLGSNDGIEVSVQNGFGVASTISGSGTALLGWDPIGTGTALWTIGGVRMQNIGEASGRVLTSDASGNATWQENTSLSVGISIRAFTAPITVPPSTFVPITQWSFIDNEDGGANYNTTTGEYTITKTGVYQVNCQVAWNLFSAPATIIALRPLINGIAYSQAITNNNSGYTNSIINFAVKFTAGDKISFSIAQNSGLSQTTVGFFSDNHMSIQFLHK